MGNTQTTTTSQKITDGEEKLVDSCTLDRGTRWK